MYAHTLRIYQVWIIASLCWHVRVDSAIILYVNWSTFTCRWHLRCVKCSTRYRWWWTLFKPNLWLRAVVCEFLRCLWLLFHGGFRRWATFCHRSYSHKVTSWPRLLIKTRRGKLSYCIRFSLCAPLKLWQLVTSCPACFLLLLLLLLLCFHKVSSDIPDGKWVPLHDLHHDELG